MNMLKCLLINLKRYLYISKHYYWIILPIADQEDMNDSECCYPNIVRIMWVSNNVTLCPNYPVMWWVLTLWLFCSEYEVHVHDYRQAECTLHQSEVSDICSYHYHRRIWPPSLAVPDLRSHWGKWLLQGQEDDRRASPQPPDLWPDRDSRLSITVSWRCLSPFRHLPHQHQLLVIQLPAGPHWAWNSLH